MRKRIVPGLNEALDHLRSGDTLIVWKPDRLGHSMSHSIDAIRDLEQREIGFRCLTESIDTTTSGGPHQSWDDCSL